MRPLAIAPAIALIATRIAVTPVHAGLLPSPLPLPSIPTTPLPLPLPSPSAPPVPGPIPSPTPPDVLGGQPSPTPGAGVTGGSSGGGGGSTRGTGAGGRGGSSQAGGSGPSAGQAGGGTRAPSAIGDPNTGGFGPLPAFPGLPHGAVQTVTWILVLLAPLMLLVWVVTLIRTLSRLRVLRSPATLIAAASELGLSPREIAGLSPVALEKLRDQLALDELTGCMRRATGVAALDREIVRARRDHTPLAIAFVDADGLKHANDTQGHQAGDQLLRDVVEGLNARLRGSDFIFRYGGDEFVCVLPGAWAGSAADVFTDVQAQLRSRGRSFSLGITELHADDDALKLLGRADEALYDAKRALKAGRQQPSPIRVVGPRPLESAAGD